MSGKTLKPVPQLDTEPSLPVAFSCLPNLLWGVLGFLRVTWYSPGNKLSSRSCLHGSLSTSGCVWLTVLVRRPSGEHRRQVQPLFPMSTFYGRTLFTLQCRRVYTKEHPREVQGPFSLLQSAREITLDPSFPLYECIIQVDSPHALVSLRMFPVSCSWACFSKDWIASFFSCYDISTYLFSHSRISFMCTHTWLDTVVDLYVFTNVLMCSIFILLFLNIL